MRAVELTGFGPTEKVLRMNPEAEVPEFAPNDVLVRVHAASVNPIDCRRCGGYGRHVYKAMGAGYFPIALGCDFSGVVEKVGNRVSRFKPGDPVWGAQEPFRSGCLADYVAVRAHDAAPKPENLSHVEAASLPYVALTAWHALVRSGGLRAETTSGKRILVHGGGGGIGTFAIQLLKTWGADVAVTCSTEKVALVRDLGADLVIDYTQEDFAKAVEGIDLVLDALGGEVGERSLRVLRRGGRIVNLHSPLMPMTDKYGSRRGFAMLIAKTGMNKIRAGLSGATHRDAFFSADGAIMESIGALVADGRIRPVVGAVLPLESFIEAFSVVASGHARGKTVLQLTDSED